MAQSPIMPDHSTLAQDRPAGTLTPPHSDSPPSMVTPITMPGPKTVLERYFDPGEEPTKHRSWPQMWQKFLEYAKIFMLGHILLGQGFPTPLLLKKLAGESLSMGWVIFHKNARHVQLNSQVCKLASFSFAFGQRTHTLFIPS
jgi:hypothetical protein